MFKKFNAKLEKLFDQPSNYIITSEEGLSEKNATSHVINNNKMLENLSYVFFEINNKNVLNLFTQLSSYFEIGLLLEKKSTSKKYHAISAFAFQQNLALAELLKPIALPAPGVYKILKTNGHQLLRHFSMSHLDPRKKMTSYLIPITPSFSILVMTPIAEPWAQLKIETLQKTLMKINFSL